MHFNTKLCLQTVDVQYKLKSLDYVLQTFDAWPWPATFRRLDSSGRHSLLYCAWPIASIAQQHHLPIMQQDIRFSSENAYPMAQHDRWLNCRGVSTWNVMSEFSWTVEAIRVLTSC